MKGRLMSSDILATMKEVMKERASERNIDKVATLKRYLVYFVDVLDIILNIQRDRRYRRYDW